MADTTFVELTADEECDDNEKIIASPPVDRARLDRRLEMKNAELCKHKVERMKVSHVKLMMDVAHNIYAVAAGDSRSQRAQAYMKMAMFVA